MGRKRSLFFSCNGQQKKIKNMSAEEEKTPPQKRPPPSSPSAVSVKEGNAAPPSRIGKKTLYGLGIAGGAGMLVYAFRDKIKRFIDWEESVEETSQNSADMLIGKLNLAKELAAVRDADIEGVRSSLLIAKKEARTLSKINREFEKRLAPFASMPAKPS
jgi:hypothetical protein